MNSTGKIRKVLKDMNSDIAIKIVVLERHWLLTVCCQYIYIWEALFDRFGHVLSKFDTPIISFLFSI